MHLAIAGNIGSGKTTLTTLLAKHYRYAPHFEEVDHNPYLNDFYKDMPRWSFNLQVYFLRSRWAQLVALREGARRWCKTGPSTRMPRSLRPTSTPWG